MIGIYLVLASILIISLLLFVQLKNKKRNTLFSVVLFTMLFFMLLGLVSLGSALIFEDELENRYYEGYCWVNSIFQVILSGEIILLCKRINIFNSNDFKEFKIKHTIHICLVGVIYVLINYILNIGGNINNMHLPTITYLLSCIFISFTTGLFEEVLVRVYAFNALKENYKNDNNQIKKAILYSSLIFGFAHVVNLEGFGLENILSCISGIITAIIIGVYFACIYHQTKNIWPAIILHTLIDGATFIIMPFLSTEILQGGTAETMTTLDIVFESFILPLIVMLPFLIADIVKWRKFDSDTFNINKKA